MNRDVKPPSFRLGSRRGPSWDAVTDEILRCRNRDAWDAWMMIPPSILSYPSVRRVGRDAAMPYRVVTLQIWHMNQDALTVAVLDAVTAAEARCRTDALTKMLNPDAVTVMPGTRG